MDVLVVYFAAQAIPSNPCRIYVFSFVSVPNKPHKKSLSAMKLKIRVRNKNQNNIVNENLPVF